MRKKLLALLSSLFLLSYSLPVSAAGTTLPISYGNNYDYTVGGGTYEYVVPYTANYEIELSGAQGASYSDNAGGYAYTLKQQIRLQYGDKIKVELPMKSSYYQSGSQLIVPSGQSAKLWINNQLVYVAGGGAGYVSNGIAPNGVTSVLLQHGQGTQNLGSSTLGVHWHSGNGVSGANHANQFPILDTYSNPGGCYVASHVCDDQCQSECGTQLIQISDHDYRDGCDWHDYHPYSARQYACYSCGDPDDDYVVMRIEYAHANELPDGPIYCTRIVGSCTGLLNHWNLGCGLQQGQILGIDNTQMRAGTCLAPSGATQTLDHAGNASFRIKLAEHRSLLYQNTPVQISSYVNLPVRLVVRDNIVTYYKRN